MCYLRIKPSCISYTSVIIHSYRPLFNCIDVSDCETGVCSNGGTCIERLGGGFHCICDEGFTGFDCSDDIVDCFPNPCENGGTCDDEVNGFTCQCTEQWTGTVCTEGNQLLQPMSQSNFTCPISAYQNLYL